MNLSDDRLPPDLRALLADVEHPPAGDSLKACIARGERAFDAVAACLGDDDPLLVEIAEILWAYYFELELDEQIEVQIQRMLAVLDRPDRAPSHQLGMVFKRLAGQRMQQKRWAEAIAACQRGITAFAGAGCADDVEAGKVQYMLGAVYMRLGKRADAREALLGSLPVLRQHAQGHTQLVRALHLLARLARMEEDPGDALSFLIEAMGVLAKEPEDSDLIFELGLDVGRCMLDVKQLGSAEQHLQAMVAMVEALRPADDPLLPRALDLLGEAQLSCGEYGEARATYERALRVAESIHGPGSAELAPLFTHLMWSHMVLEDHEAAELAARNAVAIYERLSIDSTRDSAYIDALWALAERCLEAKHFDEADQIAERLYGLVEPLVGPSAPRIGQLLGLRGRIRFERGDYEDALPLLEQGLALLDIPGAPADQYLPLARMAAEIRLFHRPVDEQVGPALERVIGALKDATREMEEENHRIRHGTGLTPRHERS